MLHLCSSCHGNYISTAGSELVDAECVLRKVVKSKLLEHYSYTLNAVRRC